MRFSVIVPLYNKAPYVLRALNSAVAQTFDDFELIIVDDGSTDESFEVASNFVDSKLDFRHKVTLIRQMNLGVSMARNNAAVIAKGDFLCFLDADDWWEPSFLTEMDTLLTVFPDGGIYGTSYYYVKSGRQQVRVNINTGYFNYFQEYAKTLQMPLWTGAVCIPKSIFLEMNGFNPILKLGEDFDLWVRIALKYKTVFLNKPLAYYNQDVDQATRGVGRLQNPDTHMLWNLDYLSEEEGSSPDIKLLLDNLRVYGLMPYYLSDQYRTKAKGELEKVDWKKQPASIRREYTRPVWMLKMKHSFKRKASSVKQFVIRLKYDS